MSSRVSSVLALAIVLYSGVPCIAAGSWTVFGHDPARSGFAAGDNAISLANVGTLHRRWVTALDAPADAAPILITNVRTPGGRTARMLFETTRSGTTYGIDAGSGTVAWRFATHGPNITTSTPA